MAATQASGRTAQPRVDLLSRDVLFRQVGALVGAVLLGFLAMAIRQVPDERSGLLVRSSILTAATVAATVLVPWQRVPSIVHRALPLVYLIVVHFTRDATGGVSSSYAQLALLPLLWVSVYGSLLELGATLFATAVVLGFPLARAGAEGAEWMRMLAMLGAGGMLAYIVCRFFGQIRRQTGKLRVLAGTDPLTGTANRRAWDEELSAAIEQAEFDGLPMSLALLDLDDFKGFNDLHGHQAGDRLLKEVSAAWLAILRMSDALARVGGDEFAVLLPACSLETAAQIAARLRSAVPAASCSVGVASWDRVETVEDLLARADAALYEAKQGGRGQVVVAGDCPHPPPTD
jgi:diguanylate cyclase (GGDEF)-like protein